MDAAAQTEDEQSKLWNGRAGQVWVEEQASLDRMFKPFENLLVDAVSASGARHVLDVGCGTGSTTIAVARLLGASGRCVGIDISSPMIATAASRAERAGAPATFICANAQDYAFEPASFDMMISRFGVMFFDDPVRAFANLRGAACAGAQLRFIAWRSAAENPFMTTAERAAAPLLPDLPARPSKGQFAFADKRHVSRIAQESGWIDIDVQPIDVECTLPEKDLIRYFSRLGPVGLFLQNVDEATRIQVIATVRPAFDPYVHGAEVRYTAACWMISAQTST